MNMPPPMTEKTYDTITDTMLPVYLPVVKEDMEEAAADLRLHSTYVADEDVNVADSDPDDSESEPDDDAVENTNVDDNGVCDVSASFDGTWQRRGYASLNGVLTAISIENGKCLDYECLTKNCKMCEMWHPRKDKEDISAEDYDEFKEHHDCPINHIGSAAAMETAGVLAVYKRSVADLNLRYMHYIGDGDSKAYPSV